MIKIETITTETIGKTNIPKTKLTLEDFSLAELTALSALLNSKELGVYSLVIFSFAANENKLAALEFFFHYASKCPSLEGIHICAPCEIGDEGAKIIARHLKNESHVHLYGLHDDTISDVGLNAIIDVLKTEAAEEAKSPLIAINFTSKLVSDESKSELANVMKDIRKRLASTIEEDIKIIVSEDKQTSNDVDVLTQQFGLLPLPKTSAQANNMELDKGLRKSFN